MSPAACFSVIACSQVPLIDTVAGLLLNLCIAYEMNTGVFCKQVHELQGRNTRLEEEVVQLKRGGATGGSTASQPGPIGQHLAGGGVQHGMQPQIEAVGSDMQAAAAFEGLPPRPSAALPSQTGYDGAAMTLGGGRARMSPADAVAMAELSGRWAMVAVPGALQCMPIPPASAIVQG
jgi:hypothetical protein